MDKSEQHKATISSNKANKKALQKVRALVIDVSKSGAANGLTSSKAEPGRSEALPEEPFHALGHMGKILLPPFDMLTLSMLVENNSELNQCIEAMETNIDATGHRFISRLRMDDITPTSNDPGESQGELTPEQEKLLLNAKKEKVGLINFFTYATSESFVSFRRKLRKDIESTGNAYFEIIRNDAGQIQGFTHLPSYQMRIGKLEEEPIEAERSILELQVDGSVKIKKQKVIRRFRNYVQSRSIHQGRTQSSITGHKVVWFKEFGDPRFYSKRDGKVRKRISKEDMATEVIHLKLYSPRSAYGLPRYIGNLLSIFGDRAAEEINWITFKNNNIPSMVIAVSNGQLTQASVDRIQSFVESQIQGSDNYSKFLLVEAESLGEEEGEDGGQVKIDIKPLTDNQHNDALFQNYSENNQDKVRRAFRLPPIFVGKAKDYTRACYSEDTETLTENGWKLYHEIQNNERIATLNSKNGKLEYHRPVNGLYLYNYKGEMIHFKNRNTDVLVTPDHKMWIGNNEKRFQKIEAKKISRSMFQFQNAPLMQTKENIDCCIRLPEDVNCGGPNSGILKPVVFSKKLSSMVIAAFVSDGNITPEFVCGKKRSMYCFSVSVKKDRKIKLMKSIFSDLSSIGLNVHKESIQNDGMHVFSVSDKRLWLWLKNNCGESTFTKHLPYWIVMDSECCKFAFDVLISTDGTRDSRSGRTSMSYSSSSIQLANQVQIMAIHLGHRSSLVTKSSGGNRHNNYRVLIVPNKPFHIVRSEFVYKEQYNGKVYCFEVPNHLFFTRRNGKVSIQGNTAESSRRLADEQIFKPERDEFDECINRVLLPEMGVIYHKYKSNTPNTTDNAQLVKILAGAEKTGGITPRIARFIIEDILGIDLPDFPEDFPADVPFSITMAQAVKNKADPTEPGQQVTALKTLKSLGIIDDDGDFDLANLEIEDLDEGDPESVMEVAKKLLSLNRAAEILWRQKVLEEAE